MFLTIIAFFSSCTHEDVSSYSYSNIEARGGEYFHRSDPHFPLEAFVEEGQSLKDVAALHSVRAEDLAKLNNIAVNSKMNTGQKLILPSYRLHIAKRSDSIPLVATRYMVEIDVLARMNKLAKNAKLREGQIVKVPVVRFDEKSKKGLHEETQMAVPVPKVFKMNISETQQSNKIEIATIVKTPIAEEIYEKPKLVRKEKFVLINTDALKSKVDLRAKFIWPIKGSITSRFGSTGINGVKNDGIAIKAPMGHAIMAAAPGQVIYVGDEIKGYGNLTIIEHESNILTSYAHQKDVKVKKGDKVKKGEVIGTVGKTGGVLEPQLHFSVRKGKTSLDPEKFLAKHEIK